MTFDEAVQPLAQALGLDAETLIALAAETPDMGDDTPHGGMSLDREEGQLLYALVRALMPQSALEIGVYDGVSSRYLVAALTANEHGDLVSYDIEDRGHLPVLAGWTVQFEDALQADFAPAEFVFEDSAHDLDYCLTLYTKLKALALRVIVAHDYYSHEFYGSGFDVKAAFDQVFGEDVIGLRWEGAPRGFGVWVNPDWKFAEPAPETAKVAVKPTRSRAKAKS